LFDGVAVRYGAGPEVLRGISFTLAPGSFHFLVGSSGAGKSSLLKLIYLGLRPAAGRVELFGRDVSVLKRSDYPAMRRRIGVVFQDFRLIEHLSAMDNVALPLRIAGVRETDIKRHVPELLGWVGLKHHLDALPATLSGGQQQRVAIARAVISRPSLLLADEPTGNVDPSLARRLLRLLIELHKSGTSVVLATHDIALMDLYDAPRLVLQEGRLQVYT
jgi:cell division transport system ATP-binding protein